MPNKTSGLLACPECDCLQREPVLGQGCAAACARCGVELYRNRPGSLDRTLAYLVAAAIVFIMANVMPLMSLDANGLTSSTTLWGASRELHETGMTSVALLVFATTLLVPSIQLAGMLYLLVGLRTGTIPEGLPLVFRLVTAVRPWAMVDVFLLGALVSLVKLTQIANVTAEPGLYAVGGYIVLSSAALASFEPRELWKRVAELGGVRGPEAVRA